MTKHCQHDGRWFSVWCGVELKRWLLGLSFYNDDNLSIKFGVGPLYVGLARYDR